MAKCKNVSKDMMVQAAKKSFDTGKYRNIINIFLELYALKLSGSEKVHLHNLIDKKEKSKFL